jgi:hypothetical protein
MEQQLPVQRCVLLHAPQRFCLHNPTICALRSILATSFPCFLHLVIFFVFTQQNKDANFDELVRVPEEQACYHYYHPNEQL